MLSGENLTNSQIALALNLFRRQGAPLYGEYRK